ncbi:hypothetical protein [Variovorax soli]|jgi:hypothetical protein|uniref:hypothetical protein n=1 Tax=Variovorax soli TaxID=376815 RepID=UPI0012947AF1|nr:hypothetical protein [Variovorax soli]
MKIRILVACFLLAAAPLATACKVYGLEHEVNFQEGSATISASEIRTLIDWYLNKRDGREGVLEAYVSAYSRPNDPVSTKLTQERVKAVADLIRAMSEGRSIPMRANVEAVATPRAEAYSTVVAGTQPMCLKTKSCCALEIQGSQ